MQWDPDQYLHYSGERALPFRHLTAAVDHLDPDRIVDLGCGTGHLTATLHNRWPQALVVGVDSSPEMINRAGGLEIPGSLRFEIGNISRWRAPQPIDLLFSNACFHWIDDHRKLFDHLLPQLAPGGTLAFQVPANHDAPSHALLRDLCASERWRDQLGGLPRTGVRDTDWYLDELGDRGLAVTVWDTTYHHVIEGPDPVYEWVKGTTLRPVYEKIEPYDRLEFSSAYSSLLRRAYPERDGRTVFPFKRLFVVATYQQSLIVSGS